MTREIDEYWLDIAHHLGIGPREQDQLSVREWQQVTSAVDQIRAELEKK